MFSIFSKPSEMLKTSVAEANHSNYTKVDCERRFGPGNGYLALNVRLLKKVTWHLVLGCIFYCFTHSNFLASQGLLNVHLVFV